MTFAESCDMMGDGGAVNVQGMAGYVKRTDLAPIGSESERYRITFVTRTASGSAGEYSFVCAVTDGVKSYSAEGTLVLDAQLFGFMLSQDWNVSTAANLESARSGSSVW